MTTKRTYTKKADPDVEPLLAALRETHRSLDALMKREDLQAWLRDFPDAVASLREARSTLYELRVGRAIEAADVVVLDEV